MKRKIKIVLSVISVIVLLCLGIFAYNVFQGVQKIKYVVWDDTGSRKAFVEKQIDIAEKEIMKDPKDIAGHMRLALAYTEKGLYDKAISEYEEVVKLKPDHVGACINLFRLYAWKNEKEKSIKWLKKAYSVNLDKACDSMYHSLSIITPEEYRKLELRAILRKE